MESNKIKINPFIEVDSIDDIKDNPFAYLDGRDENDDGILIITKEDKQYVRGDKLYLNYKGIGVFADIDDAITINTYNDELYIFRHDELSPPEDREYLVLLVYVNDDMMDTFIGISGRQEVFNYIVQNAELLDFEQSKILAETTKLKDLWTIYKFMKMCIDNDMVENPTGFDPSDYGCLMINDDVED